MSNPLSRVPTQVRDRLDSWKFWVCVAYFAIMASMVGLGFLWQKVARDNASRVATERAIAYERVNSCFTAVKNAPVTRGFLDAHEALVDSSLTSASAALATTGQDDPLYGVRSASLSRLRVAKTNAIQLRSLFMRLTPTRAGCAKLARRLGVPAG